MDILHSIILGILQGLTEFIPVSSTAHLLIGQKLLGIPASDAMFAFLIIVQMGTIVSLVIFFWRDLLALSKAFFAKPFSTPENKLGWFIVIATLPALLAGYLLKDAVEALFRIPLLEASIRLWTAAVLLTLAESLTRKSRTLDSMKWHDALIIGLFQIIAVFPGASRSGTTISAGMYCGFDRKSAARFAFLMAIPVLLAAGAYETLGLVKLPNLGSFIAPLSVGFITAAIVGWLSIKWLLNYLGKHSLYVFAAYCAILGAATTLVHMM